jgi:tetratricopeptide (TPR) repeat protein
MKHIFFLIIFILLFGCNKKTPTETKTDIKQENEVKEEIPDNIFTLKFYEYKRNNATDDEKSKSNDFWNKAQTEHRKLKKYDTSIDLYLKAINLYPKPEYYFEMGNAYIDLKQYSKAILSYRFAVKLDIDKKDKIYYNAACAASLDNQIDNAYEYLEKAMEYGYNNHSQILNDSDLINLRTDKQFFRFALDHNINVKISENVFIGIWEDSPVAASGRGRAYIFYPDKKVKYLKSSMDCDNRILSKEGTWEYSENILQITFFENTILVGGELIESTGSCGSDYEIEGGEKETVTLEEPENLLIDNIKIINDKDKLRILLNNNKFWKWYNDPYKH